MTQFARWTAPLLLLYVVALHTSMAAMEILVWLIGLIALVRMVRARELRPFPEWKPILGMTVCVTVGLLLNPSARGFWFQLGFMRWAITLWLLTAVLGDLWSLEFERRLLQVWVGICTLTAAYALFQTATGIDLIRPNAHVISFERGVWRPVGFFSRSLAFAYAFGLSFIALSLPVWRRWQKTWAVGFLTIGLLTLLATEARGAWLGLLACIVVYLAVEHRRYLVIFLAAVLAVIGGLSQTELEIGRKIHNMLVLHADPSSMMRVHLWQAYFQMWKDHPLFGIGLLQGDLFVPEYYQRLGIQEEFISNSHNVYLQWLAGAGIFSILFYLWLCSMFLAKAWRLRDKIPWGWSILMGQIFLHVGAFTENNFFTAITNHMLVFLWALLLVFDVRRTNESH